MEANLTFREQLLVLLLSASIAVYPTVATTILEVFECYTIEGEDMWV